jgi:hypothetical protein
VPARLSQKEEEIMNSFLRFYTPGKRILIFSIFIVSSLSLSACSSAKEDTLNIKKEYRDLYKSYPGKYHENGVKIIE